MDDTTPDVKISASCRPTSAGIEPDLTAVSRPELRFRESRKPPSAKTRVPVGPTDGSRLGATNKKWRFFALVREPRYADPMISQRVRSVTTAVADKGTEKGEDGGVNASPPQI
ncbi:hypothetical protein BHE74_00042983 [Ensete ventricosum]|nr:hypothetical protein BHE74_00042983 [Ensete ventricosum]